MKPKILVVEDRENLRALLVRVLSERFIVEEASDGSIAADRIQAEDFAVVLTDVKLPGVSGTDILEIARRRHPPPEVILMTAFADVPAAVAALKAGAYDYIPKPFEPEQIVRTTSHAAERYRLLRRNERLEQAMEERDSGILGISSSMATIRRMVERIGPMPIPVLLMGERGTGKEVVARELAARFGSGPFVVVSCGAIPESNLETELFGSAPDRAGLVEIAHGGTLFFDEIGELPLGLQAKIHRLLDEGEFRRVGDPMSRSVQLRVIAASSQNLDAKVTEGSLRPDLYYRLKVVTFALPPLRQRLEDIPLLAIRFLRFAAARYGTPASRFDPDVLAILEAALWPGNVRELRQVIEHAAILCDGESVSIHDLPNELHEIASTTKVGTYRQIVERAQDRAGREYLVDLLQQAQGNVTKAAIEAGVERETLHRLLRRHGLDAARYRSG